MYFKLELIRFWRIGNIIYRHMFLSYFHWQWNVPIGTAVHWKWGFVSSEKYYNYVTAHPMLVTQEVTSWAVIVPKQLSSSIRQFELSLKTAAYGMQLFLPPPTYKELSDDYMRTYVEGITSTLLSCNPKFILVVLPNNRLDRYRYVQKAD
jgi:hypothetical protein